MRVDSLCFTKHVSKTESLCPNANGNGCLVRFRVDLLSMGGEELTGQLGTSMHYFVVYNTFYQPVVVCLLPLYILLSYFTNLTVN